MSNQTGAIIIPRSFKLLEELEKGQKGNVSEGISFGLESPDDITLTNWSCTIFGHIGTTFENRIYSLSVVCGEQYPDVLPTIRFNTKINLPCVESSGKVIAGQLSVLRQWHRSSTIGNILAALRHEMTLPANRKLPQPMTEGETY
eukprot:GHVQ01003798.1.p1 GENE.GHVQ01003798.1~~GHVQ01003798.1.p1  ORF type:complete len:145 (+),score=13.92 GHVQ01003798.1:263-697(+)